MNDGGTAHLDELLVDFIDVEAGERAIVTRSKAIETEAALRVR